MPEASNTEASPEARALRVIAYPAFNNRGNNPYNSVLYSALERLGVRVVDYHAWHWLTGRFDICHVHWPETSFNGSLFAGVTTTGTLLAAIDWLKRSGTRLIWTAHNLRAHNQKHPRAEAAFWRAFLARVDGFIALTDSGLTEARARFPALAARPGVVIPHQHYRGEYPDGVSRQAARATLGVPSTARVLLFFGRVIPYKNVEGLVRVVAGLDPKAHSDIVLLVAGKSEDREYEARIRRAARGDPRIRLRFEYVPKGLAQLYFRAADLVVLPFLELYNSGSAVLALSFGRPVLLPHRGACEELRRAVGRDWVLDYDAFGSEALLGALELTLASRSGAAPDLRAFEPLDVAHKTLAAYRAILALPASRAG